MECRAEDSFPQHSIIPSLRSPIPFVWSVELLAGRQIFELAEMLRPERLGDAVLLAQPFSEIDEAAALRAKGTTRSFKPRPALLAGRAFDLAGN